MYAPLSDLNEEDRMELQEEANQRERDMAEGWEPGEGLEDVSKI